MRLAGVPAVPAAPQLFASMNLLAAFNADASAAEVRQERELSATVVNDDVVTQRLFCVHAPGPVVVHPAASCCHQSIGWGYDGSVPTVVVRVPEPASAVGCAIAENHEIGSISLVDSSRVRIISWATPTPYNVPTSFKREPKVDTYG